MRRRPSIFLPLLLLALAAGLVLLRLRGRSTCDNLWLTSQRWQGDGASFTRRQWGVVTGRGHLVLRTETLRATLADPWVRREWARFFPTERRVRHHPVALERSRDLLAEKSIGRWGFGYARRDLSDKPNSIDRRIEHSLIVPFWPLLLIAVVVSLCPAGALLRWAHRRRRGRCVGCGYDLRSTPTRCPECGTQASPANGRA